MRRRKGFGLLDAKLWAEILAAKTACVTQDAGLEAAIIKRLRREFGLNAERSGMVLLDYRRFRYLAAVAEKPLVAPPLIAFVQERDIANSFVFDEGKWWLSRSVWTNQSVAPSLEKNPAYPFTLDLYEQEFKSIPMPKIWPPASFKRLQMFALAICFTGFALSAVGGSLQYDLVRWIGFIMFAGAILFLIIDRHWAELPGD